LRIAAVHIRTGGPRPYEHGIIDLGAVVIEDGEILGELEIMFAPHDWLAYRPQCLKASQVRLQTLSDGTDYLEATAEVLSFFDLHLRGGTVFAWDAHDTEAFISRAAKMGEHRGRVPNFSDPVSVHHALRAFGVFDSPCMSTDQMRRRYGVEPYNPAAKPIDTAKDLAIVIDQMHDELRRVVPLAPTVEIQHV